MFQLRVSTPIQTPSGGRGPRTAEGIKSITQCNTSIYLVYEGVFSLCLENEYFICFKCSLSKWLHMLFMSHSSSSCCPSALIPLFLLLPHFLFKLKIVIPRQRAACRSICEGVSFGGSAGAGVGGH